MRPTMNRPLVTGPDGYKLVPSQTPYHGPPYSEQLRYPGAGFGLPAAYLDVPGATYVVTKQIVAGPGITMVYVQPTNNSLIVYSMGK